MTKFKVVRLVEIVQMPTGWKWPGTWREEFREAFEAALNRMAKEGWMYVDKMGWGDADFLSSAMLVFRKVRRRNRTQAASGLRTRLNNL